MIKKIKKEDFKKEDFNNDFKVEIPLTNEEGIVQCFDNNGYMIGCGINVSNNIVTISVDNQGYDMTVVVL